MDASTSNCRPDRCRGIYIELPAGQVSWHFHDSQAHLFSDIPRGSVKWDGHTTEEKYRRLGEIIADTAFTETRRKLVLATGIISKLIPYLRHSHPRCVSFCECGINEIIIEAADVVAASVNSAKEKGGAS
ncbi:MAG: hypothetical protein IT581_12195 [Verrucomicrobiales bacterium]|nr:hypothetical protein [Verrucomicrobiales bacterium]